MIPLPAAAAAYWGAHLQVRQAATLPLFFTQSPAPQLLLCRPSQQSLSMHCQSQLQPVPLGLEQRLRMLNRMRGC